MTDPLPDRMAAVHALEDQLGPEVCAMPGTAAALASLKAAISPTADESSALADAILRAQAAEEQAAALRATFDLVWQAQMRAIAAWQDAHPGMEAVWPDHAVLVEWLLNIAFPTPVCAADATWPDGDTLSCVMEVDAEGRHDGPHLSPDGERWFISGEPRP